MPNAVDFFPRWASSPTSTPEWVAKPEILLAAGCGARTPDSGRKNYRFGMGNQWFARFLFFGKLSLERLGSSSYQPSKIWIMAEKIHIQGPVSLQPFSPDDQSSLIRFLNDPLIVRNTLHIPTPYTEADADAWVARTQALFAQHGSTHNWAIRHAEAGLMGGIGCMLQTGLEGHLDEIGYWMAAPFRGQGWMTMVVSTLSQRMFDTRPNLVRIEAKVFDFNPGSARVLEKAGFVNEGLSRKLVCKKGELIDAFRFVLLRD